MKNKSNPPPGTTVQPSPIVIPVMSNPVHRPQQTMGLVNVSMGSPLQQQYLPNVPLYSQITPQQIQGETSIRKDPPQQYSQNFAQNYMSIPQKAGDTSILNDTSKLT